MCNTQKFFVIGFSDFTYPHKKYNHLPSHNSINCRSKHQAKHVEWSTKTVEGLQHCTVEILRGLRFTNPTVLGRMFHKTSRNDNVSVTRVR